MSSEQLVRIGVTEEAINRIDVLLKDRPTDQFFRVTINGGGCGGYQYDFDITEKTDKDFFLGDRFVIDPISAKYMNGAFIDFVDEIAGSFFKVDNPNATSTCGCGTSFSVEDNYVQ